jgi:hypothetical protein
MLNKIPEGPLRRRRTMVRGNGLREWEAPVFGGVRREIGQLFAEL